ncbi:MAG: glycerol-3-phosphate acyltransferase, partial [Clostridia bacterium]|nr:glycerol-3-phosphate acyltransferase [Clostridia bacterium]
MLDFLTTCWFVLPSVAVAAYLLGSISFAILVTRHFAHDDIRNYGSGNAGATNVLRSQGPGPALLTTLGDLGKSMVAVLLARWFTGVVV